MNYNHSTYISPFTWRYSSSEMRHIFSEEHKIKIWRHIWVTLAAYQNKAGLISDKELKDLIKHETDIDIKRILEIEKETKHDVVAAIKEYAEKAKIGGGKIHLGATSMDIVDNTDIIKVKEALNLIEIYLKEILLLFSEKIKLYQNTPCLGYTHLQPAEPTTVGYRLAFYGQDLLSDFHYLKFVKENLLTKGFKGAVGTSASYEEILKEKKVKAFDQEKKVCSDLGITPALITSQTYSRKTDYFITTLLASISSTFAKFAGDLRILQSPLFGEWSEPFGKNQVGSSAMPFKKNPINCEKICSLSRYILSLPSVCLENASLSYLERTLDDSANRRIIFAQGFLALEEILITAKKIISGLVVNEVKIKLNLNQYGLFSGTEKVIIEAVKKGADRQITHEIIREISLKAEAEIYQGKNNPLPELLLSNKYLRKYLSMDKIKKSLDIKSHIGDAPNRCNLLLNKIRKEMK